MSNTPAIILDPAKLDSTDRSLLNQIAADAEGTQRLDFDSLPADVRNQILLTVQALANGKAVASIVSGGQPLTSTKAAEVLGMSRSHLLRLCDEGRVPSHRVGNARRIDADVIIEILAARTQARTQAVTAGDTADARRRARAAKAAGIEVL